MTAAKDRPVSKPANDNFRNGYELIWGKKKAKPEKKEKEKK